MKTLEEFKSGLNLTGNETVGKALIARGHFKDLSIASFASNSSAIIGGQILVVEDFDLLPTPGNQTPDLEEDQVMTIGGEQVIVAKKGEKPKSWQLKFAGNRAVTLGLLTQAQNKPSTIEIAAGDVRLIRDLTGEQLSNLIGKKIKCIKFERDKDDLITRPNRAPYMANRFDFQVL